MKKTMLTLSFILAAYILKAQVLYGTTFYGGNNNTGTICKLATATNTLTAAFSFEAEDGRHPLYTKLLQVSDGKLYGMAREGGSNNYGVIFSYDPTASAYTQLKGFDGTNGAFPHGSLVQASDGKLYGMTSNGGNNWAGVIFSYDPATSSYTKLIDFDSTNGIYPHGSLIQASDGKLYGMTNEGGSSGYGVIFSYDPATSTYTKLIDFDGADGAYPFGSLMQASDGKLYGVTEQGGIQDYGVIFSYDPATPAYTKLRDFGLNNTGYYMAGALIKDQSNKLYGMTTGGGSSGYGVIFSYDPATSTYIKLKDLDGTNGALPQGSLMQASDEKLYGMTPHGGSSGDGVIFSYDPVTSIYIKLKDFDYINGSYPLGGLIQASDGKLYGMTYYGGGYDLGIIFSFDPATSTYTKLIQFDDGNGSNPSASLIQASDGKPYGTTSSGGNLGSGVIFSYDPATSIYTKLKDFDYTNGANPLGSLIQASDGKLYGITTYGGSSDVGVIFSYDPATSIYTKLKDFDYTNGAVPYGSLIQASDGKLYGMTSGGGTSKYGVAFSYDPATSTYTKLSDFNGDNGSHPHFTSFIEVPGEVQISMADKSVIEGNQDRKFITIPLTLSEKSSKKIIRVKYTKQNSSAKAGSDYVAQSGTLVFLPGLKKTILPIRITGDQIPEANETFRIILSDPVNATIADSTAIVTISDDDASTSNAEQKNIKTICSITLSPNPAQDKVKIMLTGYSGNVIIQLSSSDGRILQQQKLQALSAKSAQQQINVGSYANGTYLVTAIDEKGKRQTERLVIRR